MGGSLERRARESREGGSSVLGTGLGKGVGLDIGDRFFLLEEWSCR